MDSQEREKFWNTLCSLKGTDTQKDCEALRASILYPKFLYRYNKQFECASDKQAVFLKGKLL